MTTMKPVWLLLVLALAACGNSVTGGETKRPSGVVVRTVVDKGCPTHPAGTSCPVVPVVAQVIVLDTGNAVAARVTTDSDGRARIALRPGRYLLRAERLGTQLNPRTGPEPVTVTDGVFKMVTLQFDSGVRIPGPASSP
jgi:hypothetical protein